MISMSADKKHRRELTRFGELPETVSFRIREPGSALTHFIGLILFSIGAGPLLVKAKAAGGAVFAGICVYVAATCLLYAASTTYHTVVTDRKRTTFFRKLDHVSISVMIAGTYTPICVTILRECSGMYLLAAVWILALLGVGMKMLWVTCPKWLSSLIYIAMGWLCVFAMKDILALMPAAAFLFLLSGGLFYTAGAVVYAMHPEKFDEKHIYFGSHEIFHVLIMLGTLCHFIVMYRFIV
jgi:hemolysin III